MTTLNDFEEIWLARKVPAMRTMKKAQVGNRTVPPNTSPRESPSTLSRPRTKVSLKNNPGRRAKRSQDSKGLKTNTGLKSLPKLLKSLEPASQTETLALETDIHSPTFHQPKTSPQTLGYHQPPDRPKSQKPDPQTPALALSSRTSPPPTLNPKHHLPHQY